MYSRKHMFNHPRLTYMQKQECNIFYSLISNIPKEKPFFGHSDRLGSHVYIMSDSLIPPLLCQCDQRQIKKQ